MKHNSATTIKCRFSNQMNKLIDPFYGIKRSERWRSKPKSLTDKEKLELFDKIVALHRESSEELSTCLYKRREKKRLAIAREKSGYTAKKRAKKVAHRKLNSVPVGDLPN